MSVRGWMRRLGEIRDAYRALPAHLAAARDNDGRSIRDSVEELERDRPRSTAPVEDVYVTELRAAANLSGLTPEQAASVVSIVRAETARALRSTLLGTRAALAGVNSLGKQEDRLVDRADTNPNRLPERDLVGHVADLTFRALGDGDDFVSEAHESSFHVADSEVGASDAPATIMAGTPDTDPSQGDGASVEGPAPRSGPSTSSKRPVNDYIARRVAWILFIRQIRDREFAAAIGVSPSTVSRLLSGERRWRAETIRSTARFLDMSADDLFPPRDWGRS